MVRLSLIQAALVAVASASPLLRNDTSYGVVRGVDGQFAGTVTDEMVDDFRYWSEYTAAAYCAPQQSGKGGKINCAGYGSCPNLEKSSTKVYSTWYQLGKNSATGFVAADNTKDIIVISLRGSVNLANWVADMKISPLACPEYGGSGSICHTGFLGFWQESKPMAMRGLEAALAEHPDYNIVVAGHSLGAAAAMFAAADLRARFAKEAASAPAAPAHSHGGEEAPAPKPAVTANPVASLSPQASKALSAYLASMAAKAKPTQIVPKVTSAPKPTAAAGGFSPEAAKSLQAFMSSQYAAAQAAKATAAAQAAKETAAAAPKPAAAAGGLSPEAAKALQSYIAGLGAKATPAAVPAESIPEMPASVPTTGLSPKAQKALDDLIAALKEQKEQQAKQQAAKGKGGGTGQGNGWNNNNNGWNNNNKGNNNKGNNNKGRNGHKKRSEAPQGAKTVWLYAYGMPRGGNQQVVEFITKQGNNFRITHTNDAVPKLPPESGTWKHISPEYYISTGLGNKASTYEVIDGFSNSWKGNGGTYTPNIIAHIQYYSTNMYACVTTNALPLWLMGGAGSK
ncbi:hypothetical protein BT63DRAFT_457286 [Microthyrium microscopicum]|uniref:Fungal lipase-type domain-containing protein n=1 Tax=Microthyrium microscopicum TaxID=703497 RepID=A0A6A6U9J7_9PEZI|nr:hypothetical protein BT63DRAFT_457286 [Microthyrium microscopicum]